MLVELYEQMKISYFKSCDFNCKIININALTYIKNLMLKSFF